MRTFKTLLAGVATLSLIATAVPASAHSAWQGGYYHGPRGNGGSVLAGMLIGGLLANAITNSGNTQVVCSQPFWNGYQMVPQCSRVAVQPQAAPSSNGPSQACQAAMNTGDSDKISQYCNN